MTLKQKIEEAIKKLLEYFDMHLHTVNGKDVCDYCQCLICESRKPVKDAYEILRSIQPPEPGEFTKQWRERLDNAVALFKMGKNPDEWFQSIVTGFRESLTINACQDAYIEELKTENSKLKTQN